MGGSNPSPLPAPDRTELEQVREDVAWLKADRVALQETLARLLEDMAALREGLLGRGVVNATHSPQQTPAPPEETRGPCPQQVQSGERGQFVSSWDPTPREPPGPSQAQWTTVLGRNKGKGRAIESTIDPNPENTPAAPQPLPKPPKRTTKHEVERAATQTLTEPIKAAEFESVFFTLRDPRHFLSAKPQDRSRITRQIMHSLGLQKFISGVSVLPGPVVQVIAMKGSIQHIRSTLEHHKLQVKDIIDRYAKPLRSQQSDAQAQEMTARRLAALCRQSRSRNFQEEALKGASGDLHAQVLAVYRKSIRDPLALLGHKGRWYTEQRMALDSTGEASRII